MNLYMPIAGMALDVIVLLALGYSVGLLSGLFGIGGGIMMTPALTFLGVPSLVAVGTGAVQVLASSVSGAVRHRQQGNVDTLLGKILVMGGLIGVVTGIQLQALLRTVGQLDLFISISYVLVLGSVGGLMLIESIYAVRQIGLAKSQRLPRREGQHPLLKRLPLKLRFARSKLYASAIPPVAIGVVIGWLTAIMGVGGGFLLVPALIYVIRVPTRIAIGTSAYQIIFVTALNVVLQAVENHNVDVLLALPIIAGGVAGATQGATLAGRIRAEQLRVLLALLVLAIAGRMAIDLVRRPSDLFSIETIGIE